MLIFDRTSADVAAAKRILAKYQASDWFLISEAEINQLERGTITYETLNRVEGKVQELIDAFYLAGYNVNANPTSWWEEPIFNQTELSRYLDNVEIMRNVLQVYATTPATPSDFYTHQKANDIEKILFDVEILLNNMRSAWLYSGTDIYSGEEQ